MKYDSKFFEGTCPAWKRRKDSILARYFYRPLSFYGAAWAANLGLSANQVSYISAIVAVFASSMFFVNNYFAHIIGAILINFWLVLDCIDGNIARGIKKLPFGEFADAMSSYLLVGLMCTAMGVAAYQDGGVLIAAGNLWVIVLGALASNCDSLMRLIYQKYKSIERELADEGRLSVKNDVFKNPSDVGNIKVRILFEFGVAGIIPVLALLCAIFHALDLMVIYCFCYYVGSCVVNILIYARRAIKGEKEITAREDNANKPVA